MKLRIAVVLTTFMYLSAHAEQQDIPQWGVLLPALSVASDYRFNGMSLSDRKPVAQVSLHLWRPDGHYAGLWISEVDFLDGETTLEIDSYIGRDIKHGKFNSKFELMYSAFNDDQVPGPTYDFIQIKTGTTRSFGATMLSIAGLWSPSGAAGAGTVSQLRIEGQHQVTQFLKLGGLVGRRWAEQGIDRTYWDIGITLEWKNWDLDLRYHDTNLATEQCFYTDWCEGGVAAKLTLASY